MKEVYFLLFYLIIIVNQQIDKICKNYSVGELLEPITQSLNDSRSFQNEIEKCINHSEEFIEQFKQQCQIIN